MYVYKNQNEETKTKEKTGENIITVFKITFNNSVFLVKKEKKKIWIVRSWNKVGIFIPTFVEMAVVAFMIRPFY